MHIRIIPFLLFFLFMQSCHTDTTTNGILSSSEIKKVVLIGGSLISSMEDFPFLETALTIHYSEKDFKLRNIGWPADDVFGLARSQFGSAQNTQSWSPPTAEEGFGSEVMQQHIKEAAPSTLIIGYGSEAAFFEEDVDFELFESGYKRLLEFAADNSKKIILLSAPIHEAGFIEEDTRSKRNISIARANTFIKDVAQEKGLMFIDLEGLVKSENEKQVTSNGVHLNELGYEKLRDIVLDQLEIPNNESFLVEIDKSGKIIAEEKSKTKLWTKTVNGTNFKFQPNKGIMSGFFNSADPIAVFVNGKLATKSLDTIAEVVLDLDQQRHQRLIGTIKEKNRLYRYRLRPLNEAYIYLFRKHEMGHLAYEMDDLLALVSEKEKEIGTLIDTYEYDVEIELIKPWAPPKAYADDEIPAFIPMPNIQEELAAFKIADGYEMNLFATDPMIANPININWDTKGRAWVATSSTYPHIVPGREPNDKIVILEDTDGDGQADKHTIFAENLLVPHSVMPVKGGAYVAATTQLLFLEDTNGDDVADTRHVIFDGFGNADIHHTIHGLRWTPWGDLHFTQSIYINSFIETMHGTKVLNGSGTWSFRPETKELKIYSRGLVNPWGEAFDKWGQSFATDGANGTGIHYIFPESAHATAVGAPRVLPGLNNGKPKYTAADFVYSSHFPADWQGDIITNDFRANRTVRYDLKPSGSSYESEEVETLLLSEHRSYRPVDSKIGPDGALYIVDWYNPIIDHGEVDFHHPVRDKTHGRVWRLTRKHIKTLAMPTMDMMTHSDLLELLKSKEQFTRRQASRALVESGVSGAEVVQWVNQSKAGSANFHQSRLEGLWLLASINYFDETLLTQALNSRSYQEKAAAIRLVSHYKKQEFFIKKLERLIKDVHPQVRLETIHALRELGTAEAAEIATKVLDIKMDDNLDFAIALLLEKTSDEWIKVFNDGKGVFNGDEEKQMYALLTRENKDVIPHISRLLAGGTINNIQAQKAWNLLGKIGDGPTKLKVLDKARKEGDVKLLNVLARVPNDSLDVPSDLSILKNFIEHDSLDLKIAGIKLAGKWKAMEYESMIDEIANSDGDQDLLLAANRALAEMGNNSLLADRAKSGTEMKQRVVASAVWVEKAPNDALENAISVLKVVEDEKLAELLFTTFKRTENGPKLLTDALQDENLTESIASVGLRVVQTAGLNLQDLEKVIRKAGSIQSIGMELSEKEKEELLAEAKEKGSVGRGRRVYRRPELLCASCHMVDTEGGLSGPYLGKIGSFMTPKSVLESLINPNAVIKQNYETVVITKKDGQVINGILHRKTANSTLIRQANSQIVEIPASEIAQSDISPNSIMPTGLTSNLHKDELRDLLAYLMSLGK